MVIRSKTALNSQKTKTKQALKENIPHILIALCTDIYSLGYAPILYVIQGNKIK